MAGANITGRGVSRAGARGAGATSYAGLRRRRAAGARAQWRQDRFGRGAGLAVAAGRRARTLPPAPPAPRAAHSTSEPRSPMNPTAVQWAGAIIFAIAIVFFCILLS